MADIDIHAELRHNHQRAFGWALACCGWDHEEAGDALQEAYLAVLTGKAAFRGRSSFRTWFFAVVKRIASARRRGARLRSWVGLGRAVESAASAEQPGLLERSETAAELLAALTKLPRRQVEVLHLVFYEDLSIREAAEVMGVSLGSARTHYERGKKALREKLKHSRGDELGKPRPESRVSRATG